MALNIPGRSSASVNREVSRLAGKLLEGKKPKTTKKAIKKANAAAIKKAEKQIAAEHGISL